MEYSIRTYYCGEVSREDLGKEVVLNGWVQRRRDLGGLIFVDLRDRSGIVQVVFNPELDPAVFKLAENIRSEYVIAVKGKVAARPEGMVNANMPTGAVEVLASVLEILNEAKTPPIYITEDLDADEAVRFKYRYLDLRRPELQRNLILRHRVAQTVRNFLDKKGFFGDRNPNFG